MKPFRFRLEKLLNIRQQQTKMAQTFLAQAQIRTKQATAYLSAVRSERVAFETALLKRRSQGMTAMEWQRTAEAHAWHVEREREAEIALQAAITEERRRLDELAEAERNEKTLDRLKQRRAEEYRYAAEAQEQAQIDEMAQNIYREGGGRR